MTSLIGDRLALATGGRRYCFVIMTYRADWHVFEAVRAIVGEATGIECIRADDVLAPGEDLRSKIHKAIDGAAFVIADISEPRPNVYYEIGYAIAKNKETLLLARGKVKIHTDLLGVELLHYSTTAEGWTLFRSMLRKHLATQHGLSHVSLLRSMVVPYDPMPSYILSNPKAMNSQSRSRTSPLEKRTYGDHLGILGILRAFASVYGEHVAPELIGASRVHKSLLRENANLYFIGSPKVNRPSRGFLAGLQRGRSPAWSLDKEPGETDKGDYPVRLSGQLEGLRIEPKLAEVLARDASLADYGLIVRGPNPGWPARLVTILAGPHSRGTGAACLAATNSSLISRIAEKLPDGALANHALTLWVLVHATLDKDDGHLSPSGVTIAAAGVYGPE
ncbi:MAG TPA: hypothetical protein VKI44_18820 [Acetobacteraceae bacterium]|nr:hypothetical protein [Acetobacteraceae bacterium]